MNRDVGALQLFEQTEEIRHVSHDYTLFLVYPLARTSIAVMTPPCARKREGSREILRSGPDARRRAVHSPRRAHPHDPPTARRPLPARRPSP